MMDHAFARIATALIAFLALMWLVALAHERPSGLAAGGEVEEYVASAPSD